MRPGPTARTLAAAFTAAGAAVVCAPAARADTVPVDIINRSYQPGTVSVAPGSSVQWTMRDTNPTQHTVTADNGAFDSGIMSTGQLYTVSFAGEGTIPYHCNIHADMHGSVVVGTPATTTTAPSTTTTAPPTTTTTSTTAPPPPTTVPPTTTTLPPTTEAPGEVAAPTTVARPVTVRSPDSPPAVPSPGLKAFALVSLMLAIVGVCFLKFGGVAASASSSASASLPADPPGPNAPPGGSS